MRILYLMNIDWRWIKQRPHFLAEELAKDQDVLIVYRANPARSKWPVNGTSVLRAPFLPLLLQGRLRSLIEPTAQKAWLSALTSRFAPDLVWLTFPTLLPFLSRDLKELPIVYDCMDQAAAFFSDPNEARTVRETEDQLLAQASLVLCSSQHLQQDLRSRGAKNLHLLRNGVPLALLATKHNEVAPAFQQKSPLGRPFVEAGYIGTLASWMDFEALVYCLNQMQQLRIHLIGPGTPPLVHDRLIVHGPIEHHALADRVKDLDVLLMPFVVSPLIQAVDPVKLYEYLAFGKEVITCRYPEIERFGPHVHFYESKHDLLALLSAHRTGRLGRRAGRSAAFLADNTWERRGQMLTPLLKQVLAKAPTVQKLHGHSGI